MPTLNFKGKTAIETYHHTVPHHVLEFDEKLSVLSKGEKPSLEGNLIIEGDNLLALKALLPTHAGRIKCIYIDPPYNTGNEGWVYNDNLTQPQFKEWIGKVVGKEGEDATRHDKWCCMMYPRLQLLKQLLRDDGILFASISDIEVFRLKMLLDEIFGNECFLANLIWKSRQYPDARATTGISVDHEYILVYGKSSGLRLKGGERDLSKYANPDNDSRGKWMSRSILGLASKERRPNLHYPLVDPSTGNKFNPPKETGWRYDPTTMAEKVGEGRILFPKKKSGRPREKVFLEELKTQHPGFPSIIDGIHTAHGTEELRQLFPEREWLFPKPTALVEMLVGQVAEGEDIVLDSFAGSGTTGHAVLRLNAVDKSKRRFILIQMPFDNKDFESKKLNICEKITAERIRTVTKGYSVKDNKAKPVKIPALDGSYSYVRLGSAILGPNREFAGRLPEFTQLAKYIFYTETSHEFDSTSMSQSTGKIGEVADTSYFLLYADNGQKDQALDAKWLEATAAKDKNRNIVVYCEKNWVHRDDLARFEQTYSKHIRVMLVPFQLK